MEQKWLSPLQPSSFMNTLDMQLDLSTLNGYHQNLIRWANVIKDIEYFNNKISHYVKKNLLKQNFLSVSEIIFDQWTNKWNTYQSIFAFDCSIRSKNNEYLISPPFPCLLTASEILVNMKKRCFRSTYVDLRSFSRLITSVWIAIKRSPSLLSSQFLANLSIGLCNWPNATGQQSKCFIYSKNHTMAPAIKFISTYEIGNHGFLIREVR